MIHLYVSRLENMWPDCNFSGNVGFGYDPLGCPFACKIVWELKVFGSECNMNVNLALLINLHKDYWIGRRIPCDPKVYL